MNSPVPGILSFCCHHRLATLLVTLSLVAISTAGATRLTFDTDVLGLLPRQGEAIPAFRTFIQEFGSLDQLYVVFTAPEGHAIDEYDAQIDAWGERLQSLPQIGAVDTGRVDPSRDWGWLADHQLLLLPDDALRTALERLEGKGMRTALATRRELLAFPSPAVEELVRLDPLGLFDVLREHLGGAPMGINLGVAEGGYISQDGRRRLLIAQPVAPPFDTAFSHALMARLEAVRAELAGTSEIDISDEARPPVAVEFAGGHRIALETEALVRRESIWNTIGALALILPLLLIVFRSLWLVGVGPLPSAVSLVVALGALGLAGATLSAAATASAAILFGLGVDGVVLLYVAYTLDVGRGGQPARAVRNLAGPATSMLLGMWTTAATFYGLMVLDFPSLEQLGALIGHSMVLCSLFTLVIVPALLPRRRPSGPIRALIMPGLASWVARRRASILKTSAVLTLALGCAGIFVRLNPTLERLRSVTPAATFLETVVPTFGLPRDTYVIVQRGGDLQELLRSNERLQAAVPAMLPGIPIRFASMLLPSTEAQARRMGIIQSAGVSPSAVAAALDAAAAEEGFRKNAFDPFYARLPRLLDPNEGLTYDGYVAHGLQGLIGRFISRRDDEWFVVSYAFPTSSEEVSSLRSAIAAASPSVTLTGLPLVNQELSDRFLPQFLRGLTAGTLIVLALVFGAFKDLRLSLLSLAPTAVGLVWAAGILALARIELDLFAVFAVVTFVGIGVDYGIHLVHRYRERGDAGRATEELAPVILVAGAITLLGYGTLVWSSYPPLQSIGLVSLVSVLTLVAASLLVLPALLSFLDRPETRSQASEEIG